MATPKDMLAYIGSKVEGASYREPFDICTLRLDDYAKIEYDPDNQEWRYGGGTVWLMEKYRVDVRWLLNKDGTDSFVAKTVVSGVPRCPSVVRAAPTVTEAVVRCTYALLGGTE